MDGNTAAASAAELRSIVEQWFKDAGALVTTLRAIRNISLQWFPYSLAGFVTEDSQEPSWEQLHQELLNRRKVTADTLQQEEHYLQLLLKPLQQVGKNDELSNLFQLTYAAIGENFATGRYHGGMFAWDVVQNAAYDILRWSAEVRVLYQLENVLLDSPTAELESLHYQKVPAGQEPAPGYYEQRRHAYQFQKLQEECPVSEEDFNNITARLFAEHAQTLRILEQRQQHEEQLQSQQRATEMQQRLLKLLEKQETVKPQVDQLPIQDPLELAKIWMDKPRALGGPTNPQRIIIELLTTHNGFMRHADLSIAGSFNWEDARKGATNMVKRINEAIKGKELWSIIPEDNSGCLIVLNSDREKRS
jgi:hypothetical protein